MHPVVMALEEGEEVGVHTDRDSQTHGSYQQSPHEAGPHLVTFERHC